MGPKQTLKSSVFTLRALLNRCSLVCLCPSMENRLFRTEVSDQTRPMAREWKQVKREILPTSLPTFWRRLSVRQNKEKHPQKETYHREPQLEK